MPVTSVEIMKTIDERKLQKKKKSKGGKEQGDRSYSEKVRDK